MGASSSKDNDQMVDVLVKDDHIKTSEVELAFRLVDRGDFFPDNHKIDAYRDSPFKVPDSDIAWFPGRFHISAPSMYAQVLEKLELRPGLSFLNIGSGSGWLSTAAGFLLGTNGVNHGIDVHFNLVNYSQDKLKETINKFSIDAFDWCKPKFFTGNGISQTNIQYDRIYCGGAVPNNHCVVKLIKMLATGGRLIAPVGNHLVCIVRVSERLYTSENVTSCQFADLLLPSSSDKVDCLPAFDKCLSLRDMCRNNVRRSVRRRANGRKPVAIRSAIRQERGEEDRDEGHVDLEIPLRRPNNDNIEEGPNIVIRAQNGDGPEIRLEFMRRDGDEEHIIIQRHANFEEFARNQVGGMRLFQALIDHPVHAEIQQHVLPERDDDENFEPVHFPEILNEPVAALPLGNMFADEGPDMDELQVDAAVENMFREPPEPEELVNGLINRHAREDRRRRRHMPMDVPNREDDDAEPSSANDDDGPPTSKRARREQENKEIADNERKNHQRFHKVFHTIIEDLPIPHNLCTYLQMADE